MALSRTGTLHNLPCSFEGLREEDARRALGGALRWLRGYADELVENKSFAELLCTRQKELLNPITERPLHFPLKAVQLAFTFLWDDGTPRCVEVHPTPSPFLLAIRWIKRNRRRRPHGSEHAQLLKLVGTAF